LDFFAESIEGLPSLSYIAAVGRCTDNIGDEIISRINRIKKASPEKNCLALDMRGVTNVEAKHFSEFQKINDTLNQINWKFYLCNIPDRLNNIFNSGRFKKNLNIFPHKSGLIDYLKSDKKEKKTAPPAEPLTVVFRTSEGIRLFEARAVKYFGEKELEIFTKDKNASMFQAGKRSKALLYFDSPSLQLLPQEIKLTECEKVDKPKYNYRLRVKLTDITPDSLNILKNYFQ
jgi:anti-anti-sigma regulatory factor